MSVARHHLLLRVTLVAALVLGLGMSRLLVLCTHHDGQASLEWTHAEGTCCHHDGHDGDRAPGGDPAIAPGAGCEHDSLAFDVMPTPKPDTGGEVPAPPAFALVLFTLPPPPSPDALPHPPATGPPRTDRRTELRATSLLLL